MRTYFGIAAVPAVVSVVDDQTGKVDRIETGAEGGDFSWGDKSQGAYLLALAILRRELNDEQRATALARRFMWRMVVAWPAGMAFRITSSEIVQVIRSIEEVEHNTAGARNRVITERPPVEHDGGIGAGGLPIVWDSDGGLR